MSRAHHSLRTPPFAWLNVGRHVGARPLAAKVALATGWLLPLALLFASATARANETAATSDAPHLSAPAIYTQNCVACHAAMTGGDGHVLYQRDDRLARDYDSLHRRVNFCQTNLKLSWSATQVKLVSDYLNRKYYRYPAPPSQRAR